MPNWCSTKIAINCHDCGNKKEALEQLAGLQAKLQNIFENRNENSVWESVVADYFGIPEEGRYCRGEICNMFFEQEYIIITQTDAWSPNVEFWEDILEQNYPSLSMRYMAVEPGLQVYVNTDRDGFYFPDKYAVSFWCENESVYGEEGWYNYESDAALLKDWAARTGRNFASVEELKSFADEVSNDNNVFLSINEFACE